MNLRSPHQTGVRPEAWAETTVCPGCDRCSILRSDTGHCEICTAKRPEKRREWEAARRRTHGTERPDWYRPVPLEPTCFFCNEPLNKESREHHEQYVCRQKGFVCRDVTCGRRYYLRVDRDKHHRKAHGFQD